VSGALAGAPGLLVFSPWTMRDGGEAERRIRQFSETCPVVAEAKVAGMGWMMRIYAGGDIVLQEEQLVATSGDRRDAAYPELGRRVMGGERLWIHPDTGHRFLLLICGEMNIILGRESSDSLHWDESVMSIDPIAHHGVHGVLNPSHTRFGPQPMRDKHAFLARESGAVVCASNTFQNHPHLGSSHVPNKCRWRTEDGSVDTKPLVDLTYSYLTTMQL
jgi:hypothetical protein